MGERRGRSDYERSTRYARPKEDTLSFLVPMFFALFSVFFSVDSSPQPTTAQKEFDVFFVFFSFASKIPRILSPGFLFVFFRRRGQIGTKEKKTEANHRGTTEEEAGERGEREVAGLHVRVSVSVSALEVP